MPSATRWLKLRSCSDEAVERQAGRGRACKQRGRSAAKIFLHILQVVAELQQHTPLEGEAAFFRCEPGLGEARIGQDAGSALGATDPQQLELRRMGPENGRRC